MLYDLSTLTCIAVTGKDARQFLQGQLTCDVNQVSDSQTCLAAHCNLKGRVLSFFRVLTYLKTCYLLTTQDMVAANIAQLKKYATFSKVQIEAVDNLHALGVGGTQPPFQTPQNAGEAIYLKAQEVLVIRVLKESLRFILVGKQAALRKLQAHLFPNEKPAAYSDWVIQDIKAHIATICPATAGLFTPHMLGYIAKGVVNFQKGCYLGQEVIARIHYLGTVKKQLTHYTVCSKEAPLPGTLVYDAKEQPVGTITSSAMGADKTVWHLLVVLDKSARPKRVYWHVVKEAAYLLLQRQ